MKVFVCKVLKDENPGSEEKELMSDSFKYKIEDGFYVLEGRYTAQDNTIDDSKIGGNKSAEATEDDNSGQDSVIVEGDVMSACKLVRPVTINDKKDFKKYLSKYVKKLTAVLEKNGEPLDDKSKKEINTKMALFLKNFKAMEFFVTDGDEYECDGAMLYVENEKDYSESSAQVGDKFKAYAIAAGLEPIKF